MNGCYLLSEMEGTLSTDSNSDSDSDLLLSAPVPPLQIVDDSSEYGMTTSQALSNSAKTPRNRSILKTSRELSGCEAQARSSRSKSVTFSVPGDAPRKRKERNPLLKVFEAFDRKFSHDYEISPTKPKVGIVEMKHEEKSGSPSKSESNLPYWITYLQMNQKRRHNQSERGRRTDFKRESGRVFTSRSSSLNSVRSVESTRRRSGHPFWSNGGHIDYRSAH
uniref:Uncharacterized protein n=1 Tax=Parascaris univalens TaxID=6257 RepID=A0A915BAM4_PARUN